MRRLLSIVLVLMLAACSAPTPTAVLPAPTQAAQATATAESAPVDEPTPAAAVEPTAAPAPTTAAEPSPTAPPAATTEPTLTNTDSVLLGAAWEWTASENPGCDLLIFQADGSLTLQSGCSAGQGTYQISGSNLSLALPAEVGGDLPRRLAGVTGYAVRAGTLVLSAAGGEVSFAPRALLQAQPPAEGSAVAALKYNARVYIGPSRDYPVVGILPAGSTVAVTVRIYKYDVWGIAMPGLPDGYGWIQASAADVAQVDAVPYTAIEKLQVGGDALLWPNLDDPRASVNGEVPIYAGPSDSYALVMAGLPGDTFYVLGKSEDGAFLVVFVPPAIAPGGLGWIQASLIETRNTESVPVFKAPPAPGKSRFMQPNPGQPYAAAMTSVNIRGGPGVEYTVFRSTERGEIVLITGVTPDGVWYRIRVPKAVSSDEIAWISAPNVRAFNTGAIQVVQYPFPIPEIRTDTLGPQCEIVSQKPLPFTLYHKGITFTLEFEIRNNTDYTWSRGDVDFVYIDNIDNWPMHTGADRIDLEENVIPGNTTIVTFEAKTPTKHKYTYGERWVVRKAGQTVCAFTYQIRTQDD
jgi:uncharacterized protein YraI